MRVRVPEQSAQSAAAVVLYERRAPEGLGLLGALVSPNLEHVYTAHQGSSVPDDELVSSVHSQWGKPGPCRPLHRQPLRLPPGLVPARPLLDRVRPDGEGAGPGGRARRVPDPDAGSHRTGLRRSLPAGRRHRRLRVRLPVPAPVRAHRVLPRRRHALADRVPDDRARHRRVRDLPPQAAVRAVARASQHRGLGPRGLRSRRSRMSRGRRRSGSTVTTAEAPPSRASGPLRTATRSR